MTMITLSDYWMGRDELYPLAMTPQIEHNALIMIDLANRLLTLAKGAGVQVREMPNGGVVTSGWRPPAINAATHGASPASKHMTAQAIDLYDPSGRLDMWMSANQQVLKDLGLWQEHPSATPNWAHVQSVPPASGNRVFYP